MAISVSECEVFINYCENTMSLRVGESFQDKAEPVNKSNLSVPDAYW